MRRHRHRGAVERCGEAVRRGRGFGRYESGLSAAASSKHLKRPRRSPSVRRPAISRPLNARSRCARRVRRDFLLPSRPNARTHRFHGQTVMHRPEKTLTVQLGDGRLWLLDRDRRRLRTLRANMTWCPWRAGAPLAPATPRARPHSLPPTLRRYQIWLPSSSRHLKRHLRDRRKATPSPSIPTRNALTISGSGEVRALR